MIAAIQSRPLCFDWFKLFHLNETYQLLTTLSKATFKNAPEVMRFKAATG